MRKIQRAGDLFASTKIWSVGDCKSEPSGVQKLGKVLS